MATMSSKDPSLKIITHVWVYVCEYGYLKKPEASDTRELDLQMPPDVSPGSQTLSSAGAGYNS